MDKTLVSIIVPVYNVQDYVERCLKSLARQSYANIEMIIVDDGSTDGSRRICDDFATGEGRAKVYHKTNGGLSEARNFGIKKARGEYVLLVDSDDYVEKDFVAKLLSVIKDSSADIAVCGFNNEIPRSSVISGKEATKKLLIKQENIEIVAWNKIYNKNLFTKNEIWYPVGMKHEDALTTYKLLSKAERVVYLNKSLYHYVVRDDSIMANGKIIDRLKMRELAAEEAEDYFSDNHDLLDAAKVSLLLAKYAYMDASIHGEIEKKYYDSGRKWVKKHAKKYRDNKFLTKKLKLYNFLVSVGLYRVFRKVI